MSNQTFYPVSIVKQYTLDVIRRKLPPIRLQIAGQHTGFQMGINTVLVPWSLAQVTVSPSCPENTPAQSTIHYRPTGLSIAL